VRTKKTLAITNLLGIPTMCVKNFYNSLT
jgi:hypothetical protein